MPKQDLMWNRIMRRNEGNWEGTWGRPGGLSDHILVWSLWRKVGRKGGWVEESSSLPRRSAVLRKFDKDSGSPWSKVTFQRSPPFLRNVPALSLLCLAIGWEQPRQSVGNRITTKLDLIIRLYSTSPPHTLLWGLLYNNRGLQLEELKGSGSI